MRYPRIPLAQGEKLKRNEGLDTREDVKPIFLITREGHARQCHEPGERGLWRQFDFVPQRQEQG